MRPVFHPHRGVGVNGSKRGFTAAQDIHGPAYEDTRGQGMAAVLNRRRSIGINSGVARVPANGKTPAGTDVRFIRVAGRNQYGPIPDLRIAHVPSLEHHRI